MVRRGPRRPLAWRSPCHQGTRLPPLRCRPGALRAPGAPPGSAPSARRNRRRPPSRRPRSP
eukprot:7912480-Alexandrium_andersonii.AAC.1